MSFKSKLKVGGKELNILDASYDLFQEVDASGRPSSVTRGGTINLTVESTGDSFFFEWMTNNFERKDGSIQYVKRDTDAKLKELNFKEGYLIKYKESFDATGTNPLVETFTISAKEISMGGGEHINEWV
ncbi:phage tail protein [Flavobacterium sp. 316]|uniref:Phage tail protein n=1 Tax=Flavobacterium sediminilitoris TaxID=2024526 RepID=A0ABY4HRF2_9FLAO|nr:MULTISPECIES: type VI secretion system tube protein TssD [Flavobacterium]KIX21667.1 phage tail protein [Flavobacterium sp. 316]UOX35472.1 phage tail protein [Flavobacterium sediminilitoris]